MTGMEWLLWMLAVAILGLAAVASTGRLGELPSTVTNTPVPHLPVGVLTGTDLEQVRFAVVTRGYSMPQVDELLARLSLQLDGVAAAGPEAIQSSLEGETGSQADDTPLADSSEGSDAQPTAEGDFAPPSEPELNHDVASQVATPPELTHRTPSPPAP